MAVVKVVFISEAETNEKYWLGLVLIRRTGFWMWWQKNVFIAADNCL